MEPDFTIVLRGYACDQVDAYIERLSQGSVGSGRPAFKIVLRGYERTQVNTYLQLVEAGPAEPARVPEPRFTVVLRGYEVTQVNTWVATAQARIAKLEAAVARLQSEE